MKQLNVKKLVLLNLPYFLLGLFATNLGEAWRLATGADASAKMLSFFSTLPVALGSWWPSLHPLDLAVGICCGAGLRLAVYLKGKNAKKYRHNVEYGSARWGTHEDIAPYIDPVFQNNVILTQTERLTMSSRPKNPKYARNKNVLVIGGSGSGKTRFWLKPNLMQMHSSYVVTDPKGTILVECGKMLQRGAPKLGKDGKPVKDKHGKIVYEPYQIKVLNTINFKKSMHYNPFSYIHSEKDILKLVTTLIANTKGEGKAGDDFWVKAETLLYCALIGYIHYEAPVEEQNFSTLIEMINSMEVREDDEEFKNAVDLMFDELKEIIEEMRKGVPLGYFTSQWFGNFYLKALDHYIKEELHAEHYMRYMDDMVILGKSKKKLHKIHAAIETYLNDNLDLEIKGDWQVFRFEYPVFDKSGNPVLNKDGKQVTKGRMLDFMGFQFHHDRTTIRKSNIEAARRKANHISKQDKISWYNASVMLSYMGLFKHTDTYNYYIDYIKPKINVKKLKRIVSKHSRKENEHDRLEKGDRNTAGQAGGGRQDIVAVNGLPA